MRTLEEHMDELFHKYKLKTTLSIFKGVEKYSAFGDKDNASKKLGYFGNVVSRAKKALSNSSQNKAKIIISELAFDNSRLNKKEFNTNKCLIAGNKKEKIIIKNWGNKNL